MQHEKVIIIGSGPAGLTAALYAARANLSPLVIAGDQIGGQVAITSEVENYPGFPDGITGPELVEKFREQAERFGARIEYDIVVEVDFTKGRPFYVKTYGNEYEADAVIVTAGATPRKLNVPGERECTGRGVSYCGTCDGFFFRGKDIVVVGGGDSALEEADFLTRYANSVNIVHRRDELRASYPLQQRALNNPKISFTWDTVVEEILQNEGGMVSGVRLRNVKTDEVYEKPTDGVFIFIGHDPNNTLFEGQLEMGNHGYVIVNQHMMTSVEGVFAAGEIMDPMWRQVATSVGQGCAAAMACERWMAAQGDVAEPTGAGVRTA
ncbi:MAG: thioredoxin-disulfide reductase [Anaerolineae bacterium]|nr:thioredoxin-disulfide reductase [Anaerolineae bacterium]